MPWQDVSPFVCASHAGIVSKRLTYPQFFTPSGSPTILVFPHQTEWKYSDGDPLTGTSNARGMKQEAQLSQRDRATLCVIKYFAKSLKVRNNTVA